MKGGRKQLSKRTRFEVFKRDSFKCQYCGASAPDVLLDVDHIHPVSQGGDDGLLNLITACQDCNSGKAAVPLSENAAVKKQMKQLRGLAARREQLEMLIQWRDGLNSIEEEKAQIIIRKVGERLKPLGYYVSDDCALGIRAWIKRFGFENVLYGVQQAFLTEPVALFQQMKQFSAAAAKVAREPELRDFWRIRARLRARGFHYGAEWEPIEDMRRSLRAGFSIADLDQAAGDAWDYEHFLRLIGYGRRPE